MTSKKIKILLTSSSIATASFFAGKYYEKRDSTLKLQTRLHHDTPIFTSFIENQEPKNTFEDIFCKATCYVKRFLPKNIGIIEAATPIPDAKENEESENKQLARRNVGRISQIMKYGYPSMDNIISYSDYVLSYDKRNRVAHWVFEHLTEESCKSNKEVDRSTCQFTEASHIHPFFRSQNSDYKGSGFDRGHLAAAGNHKSSQQCIEETFYLTNMAPQVGNGFNRHIWNDLEKYVRKLTRNYLNVYCCTGPLYLPKRESNGKLYIRYQVIGNNHVAVPTHFFKVVVGETKDGNLDMECYVMPNEKIEDGIPLKSFLVPPETIERASGLLFFDNVLRNKFAKINGKKT